MADVLWQNVIPINFFDALICQIAHLINMYEKSIFSSSVHLCRRISPRSIRRYTVWLSSHDVEGECSALFVSMQSEKIWFYLFCAWSIQRMTALIVQSEWHDGPCGLLLYSCVVPIVTAHHITFHHITLHHPPHHKRCNQELLRRAVDRDSDRHRVRASWGAVMRSVLQHSRFFLQ